MNKIGPPLSRSPEDEEEAERLLLDEACDEARWDNRWVSHEKVRVWLLRLANGEFDAPPPTPED